MTLITFLALVFILISLTFLWAKINQIKKRIKRLEELDKNWTEARDLYNKYWPKEDR